VAGVGSAAIGAFLPMFFLHQGWPSAGLGLALFGGAYVLVRILFGHLRDRVGSVPVTLVSVTFEAAGQCLPWAAPSPAFALVGACLTGFGWSMMFPAMGMEVVRRVPPHLRGAAGGLAAFQDLAFGLTGPATGLLADRFGYSVVFLIAGLKRRPLGSRSFSPLAARTGVRPQPLILIPPNHESLPLGQVHRTCPVDSGGFLSRLRIADNHQSPFVDCTDAMWLWTYRAGA
jgi:MFS family permease